MKLERWPGPNKWAGIKSVPRIRLHRSITCGRLGASFPEEMDRKIWKGIWGQLQCIEASLNFIIGDWLNYGLQKYGEKYAYALDATEWQYGHLANCAYVCANVDFSLRNEKLDWSHHAVVAPLAAEEQAKFLTLAAEGGWTVSALRIAVRKANSTRTRSSAKVLGFVPAAWVAQGLRWFRQQDLDDWSEDRKEALRQQLRPLADIYQSLIPTSAHAPITTLHG